MLRARGQAEQYAKALPAVEPAIFGTLLERALDERERERLGAHYTPRAYVERLVLPTIIEPLRSDWEAAKAAAVQLADSGDNAGALVVVSRFQGRTSRVICTGSPGIGRAGCLLFRACAAGSRRSGARDAGLTRTGARNGTGSLRSLTCLLGRMATRFGPHYHTDVVPDDRVASAKKARLPIAMAISRASLTPWTEAVLAHSISRKPPAKGRYTNFCRTAFIGSHLSAVGDVSAEQIRPCGLARIRHLRGCP
jgi:hypothetical protein